MPDHINATREYEHAKAKGRVYHFMPDLLPQGAPRDAGCRSLAEYRDIVIEKTPYGVKYSHVRDGITLPYGSRSTLDKLDGLWSLGELLARIDRALDHPTRKELYGE